MPIRSVAFVGPRGSSAPEFINYLLGFTVAPTDVDPACPTVFTAANSPSGARFMVETEDTRVVVDTEAETTAAVVAAWAKEGTKKVVVRNSVITIDVNCEFVLMPGFQADKVVDISAYTMLVCMDRFIVRSMADLYRNNFKPVPGKPCGVVFFETHPFSTAVGRMDMTERGVTFPVFMAWNNSNASKELGELLADDTMAREEAKPVSNVRRKLTTTPVSSPAISDRRSRTPPRGLKF